MTEIQTNNAAPLNFEALKINNAHNAEYWSARDLQPILGYSQWRRFEDAIKRAMTSCETSGNDPAYHFAGAGKMIELGKGGLWETEDFLRPVDRLNMAELLPNTGFTYEWRLA